MAETADQIRVTVLYPLPVQPERDTFLKDVAALNDGDFIGSGTDGMKRDLVFNFPMLCFGGPNNLPRFLEAVLKDDCQVFLSKLVSLAVVAEASAAVEVGSC